MMTPRTGFQTGLEVLLADHAEWLRGARVALLSHQAAVNRNGVTSAELFRRSAPATLTCLLGPEHGFKGAAGAGVQVADQRESDWGVPVYSLYGDARRPTDEMLQDVEVIVFDLQNLAARCYTYVSTLRYVMESLHASGKALIVADRPVPLPSVLDGPLLEPEFESFVGCVPAPLCYGMTPGETALWLRAELALDLEVKVSRLRGYHRRPERAPGWPPWVPPSPAIRAWECGMAYTATVYVEALPLLHCARASTDAFRVLAAPGRSSARLLQQLNELHLPGVSFRAWQDDTRAGIIMDITQPRVFRPVRTGITLLSLFQQLLGAENLWRHPSTRESFFDQLMGTDRVRRALQSGATPESIATEWEGDLSRFAEAREPHLLYGEGP